MPEAIILSHWLYYARWGDTIDSVTVGREAKPDADPAGNWTGLGKVAAMSIEDNSQYDDILVPNPGKVEVYDELQLLDDRSFSFSMIEMSPEAVELLLKASGAITTTFVPGAQTSPMKAFIKVQSYNQDNELVTAMDVACIMRAGNFSSPLAGRVTYDLICRQIQSGQTTGNLSNLA